ncbi:MAG: SGNH/GDSL hydrolase family protein [Leptothrix ochracea]
MLPPEAAEPPNAVVHATARAVLAPLLMWQAAQVRRQTPRLPEAEGDRIGVAGSGPVQLRLLVVGDSTAAGVGVDQQCDALAALLARELVPYMGGAVAWQLVARTGLSARGTLALMAASKLQPADVMITALGINDALEQVSPSQWLRYLNAIHHHARGRAGVRHTVHCAPPRLDLLPFMPSAMRWVVGGAAGLLDEALQDHVRGARRRSRFVLPFDPQKENLSQWLAADGFHPNKALYAHWAVALAAHVHAMVTHVPEAHATRPSGFSAFDTLR